MPKNTLTYEEVNALLASTPPASQHELLMLLVHWKEDKTSTRDRSQDILGTPFVPDILRICESTPIEIIVRNHLGTLRFLSRVLWDDQLPETRDRAFDIVADALCLEAPRGDRNKLQVLLLNSVLRAKNPSPIMIATAVRVVNAHPKEAGKTVAMFLLHTPESYPNAHTILTRADNKSLHARLLVRSIHDAEKQLQKRLIPPPDVCHVLDLAAVLVPEEPLLLRELGRLVYFGSNPIRDSTITTIVRSHITKPQVACAVAYLAANKPKDFECMLEQITNMAPRALRKATVALAEAILQNSPEAIMDALHSIAAHPNSRFAYSLLEGYARAPWQCKLPDLCSFAEILADGGAYTNIGSMIACVAPPEQCVPLFPKLVEALKSKKHAAWASLAILRLSRQYCLPDIPASVQAMADSLPTYDVVTQNCVLDSFECLMHEERYLRIVLPAMMSLAKTSPATRVRLENYMSATLETVQRMPRLDLETAERSIYAIRMLSQLKADYEIPADRSLLLELLQALATEVHQRLPGHLQARTFAAPHAPVPTRRLSVRFA